MSSTTLVRCRAILADDFPSFDGVARRLREAGLLPAGAGGRDGVGSALLDYRQTVLLLLGLCCGAAPADAPAEAMRIGSFRLLRHDTTRLGGEDERRVYEIRTSTY
jgi:hypothetical protein